MDKQERMFFEAGTDDLSVQAVAFSGGQDVNFSCNDEWCGSTETGFGATVCVSLNRDDAVRLRDFLDAWLKTPNSKVSGAGTASTGLPGYAAGGNGERK